jgi:iron(III) transport system substrate-binding protein
VRSLIALLLAVLAVAGLAACGGDDEQSFSRDGSQLTIYSGRDKEFVEPLIDGFKETHPSVDVRVRYGDGAELAATIREEGDRSPADMFFSQDAGALGALQAERLLASLPEATLGRVDARFRSDAGDWVGTSGRVRVLGYDKRKHQEATLPESVFDLTKPEWRGKVGWAPTNASFQAFVTAMRKVEGEQRTREWLEAMQANDTQAYEKNTLIRDAIADGEIEVGLLNHYYVLEAEREAAQDGESYPVGLHFFPGGDVGSLVNVAGAGVLASAARPQDAQAFIDFLLSRGVQDDLAGDSGEYPLVEGASADPSLPPLDRIEQPDIDLADLADLQSTLELLQDTGVL